MIVFTNTSTDKVKNTQLETTQINTKHKYVLNRKYLDIVVKECILQPVINKIYIDYKIKYIIEQKKVVVLDSKRIVKNEMTIHQLENLQRQRKKFLKRKKRERLDKQDALSIVFSAFESKPKWTLKNFQILAESCRKTRQS